MAYVAEILPKRSKTTINRSINHPWRAKMSTTVTLKISSVMFGRNLNTAYKVCPLTTTMTLTFGHEKLNNRHLPLIMVIKYSKSQAFTIWPILCSDIDLCGLYDSELPLITVINCTF
jgi:hypothetical protein